ncbi:MAG: YraN family protein [Defluviitaleaceae bacterium]|nr:YraN family protein [Defluviitaleaceae bacterium]
MGEKRPTVRRFNERNNERNIDSKRNLGNIGEDIAASYLARQGYNLLQRNYRCGFGEIDVICHAPDGYLVFVEVKARKNDRFGVGYEAVVRSKRAKIIRTAMNYISENGIVNEDMRFDVISVSLCGDNSIEHIVNAFDAM